MNNIITLLKKSVILCTLNLRQKKQFYLKKLGNEVEFVWGFVSATAVVLFSELGENEVSILII
jgi:hypothetical protein